MSTQTSAPATRPARPREASDSGAVIVVDDLTKSYGERSVLGGVSFAVAQQEIFGILGPNGAGKTTAVEIVQGLRRRDGGSALVLGHDPAHERASLRGQVGAQLQSSALPDHLKVGEALRMFARLAGDVVDWRSLSAEWGLTRLEKSAFGSLSGGEQQRLFLALALVNDPQVVFLDELTQGLDPSARRETWRLIQQVRDQGTTVVLVSHFIDEVEYLCDRAAVLYDGRLTAIGTPQELVATVGGAVRVRFSTQPGLRGETLSSLPGVQSVQTPEDDPTIEVIGDAAMPVRVGAELVRQNVVPTDFSVTHPSLEDVFVTLTEGSLS